MRIAALQALGTQVAAATPGSPRALAATAQPQKTAGQLTPAAIHPTPPASGVRPVGVFDEQPLALIHQVPSQAGAGGVFAEPSPAAVPSATPVVFPLPPATSVPPLHTQVRRTVATSAIDGQSRDQADLGQVNADRLGEIAVIVRPLRLLHSR